jgi:hypothetical protein
MATFDIVLRTTGSLHPESEPDDFVSCHSGFIRRTRLDGKTLNVGLVRAHRIHAGLAEEAGVPLFDVCDAHCDEMNEVYAALFDPHTDDLKEEIRADFDVFHSDCLIHPLNPDACEFRKVPAGWIPRHENKVAER